MASRDSFIDVNSLARTALGMERLKEQRQGNVLRERELGMRERESVLDAQRNRLQQQQLKLENIKQKNDLLNQARQDPALAAIPGYSRFIVQQQAKLLQDETGLPMPSEEDLLAGEEHLHVTLNAVATNPNSPEAVSLMAETAVMFPDFGKKVLDFAGQFGTLRREFADASIKRERHEAELKQINQSIATARVREGVLTGQAAHLQEETRRLQTFQETMDEVNLRIKRTQADKRDAELARIRRDDKRFQEFDRFADARLQEIPAFIINVNEQMLSLTRRMMASERTAEERQRLSAQRDALTLVREAYERERTYLELAKSVPADDPRLREAFKAFENAQRAVQREQQQAVGTIDSLKRDRLNLARERLDLSTQEQERKQEKQTREFGREDRITKAAIAFGDTDQSEDAIFNLARQFNVTPTEIREAAQKKPGRLSVSIDPRVPTRTTISRAQEQLLSIPRTISTIDRVIDVVKPENIGVVGGTRAAIEGVVDQIHGAANMAYAKAQRRGDTVSFRLFDLTEQSTFDVLMNTLAFEWLSAKQGSKITDKDIALARNDIFGFGKTFPSAAGIRQRLTTLREGLVRDMEITSEAMKRGFVLPEGRSSVTSDLSGLSNEQLMQMLFEEE